MATIPNNWERASLSDIVRCQGGSAFSPALQGRTDGDIPFFKVSDMNLPGNEWFMRRANNYVSHADRHRINGSEKPAGAVIFPKVGGAIHTNKKRLLTRPVFVDNNVMAVWSIAPSRCIPAYLYLYFLTKNLSEFSNPGPLPSINNSKIEEQTIVLPPVAEQEKIAAVVWAVQRRIAVEEKLVETAHELKQSAMHQLFACGVRGKPQQQSEIGLCPGAWEVIPLGRHLTQAQYGLSIRGGAAGRVPILRMNCQVNGRVEFNDLQFVDIDNTTLEAFRVHDGDLLFNRTNSHELVGRMAIYRSEREVVFASYLIRLSLDQRELNPEFVNYYFNQQIVQADIKRLASRGVSQSNINATKLRDYPVPKAPLEEQQDVVAVLQGIDRKIDVHERKLAALRDLFKALLDKLMVGDIRVADLAIDTSDVAVH